MIQLSFERMVSVIMPAYNARPYIGEAINSVLSQDYPYIELIVVDDGSTDGTAAYAEEFGDQVRVFRQANAGVAAARNKGLAEAKGGLIAFLDADDLWCPGKLSAQVAYLEKNPEIGGVYGKFIRWEGLADGTFPPPLMEQKDSSNVSIIAAHSGSIYRELLFDNIVHIITAVIRRSAIEDIGGFDEGLRTGEDYDLWLRMSLTYRMDKLDRTLAYYRVHPQSTTAVPRAENNEYKVLMRILERAGPAGAGGAWKADKELRERLFRLCFSHGYFHYWRGSPAVAKNAFYQAIMHSPLRPRAFIYWVLAGLKQFRKGYKP